MNRKRSLQLIFATMTMVLMALSSANTASAMDVYTDTWWANLNWHNGTPLPSSHHQYFYVMFTGIANGVVDVWYHNAPGQSNTWDHLYQQITITFFAFGVPKRTDTIDNASQDYNRCYAYAGSYWYADICIQIEDGAGGGGGPKYFTP